MQALYILVLFTASYTVAFVNIYLDGPILLNDCQRQGQEAIPMVGAPSHIHARKEPVGSTMKKQVDDEPVDQKAFYLAAWDGDLDYIQSQLEEGKTSSNSRLVNWHSEDDCNRTALINAIEEFHVSVAEVLLKAGASPNAMNCDGMTPIHYGAWLGQTTILRAMLRPQYQANVNLQDNAGKTPVYWAAGYDRIEALEELLARDADPNIAPSNGFTPLMVASQFGHVDIAKSLIRAGARIGDTDGYECTALHVAAYSNKPEAVKLLLQNGANKRHQDYNGDTAADRARQRGFDNVADLIDNWQ